MAYQSTSVVGTFVNGLTKRTSLSDRMPKCHGNRLDIHILSASVKRKSGASLKVFYAGRMTSAGSTLSIASENLTPSTSTVSTIQRPSIVVTKKI